jgi:hypothetical protein
MLCQKAIDFLDWQGFDMQQYATFFLKVGYKNFLKMEEVIILHIFTGINM